MGLLLPLLNYSQSGTAKPIISALAPGALVPRNMISSLLKQQLSGNKVQSVEGKAIILDFFSVYCGTCIKKLPEMNALQEQYRERLQILVVTQDDPATLQKFTPRFSLLRDNELPVVRATNDILKAFPYASIPHLVLLDSTGRITAITNALAITPTNMDNWMKGKQVSWPFKKDLVDFDWKISFAQNSAFVQIPQYRSFLSDSLPGVPPLRSQQDLSDGLHTRYFYINGKIPELYLFALRFKLGENRVLVSEEIKPLLANKYCYELITPKLHNDSICKTLMFQDLNSRLGLEAFVAERTIVCRILRALPDAEELLSRTLSDTTYPENSKRYRIKKGTINQLVYAINLKGPLLIDETGLKGKYALDISIEEINNLEILNRQLRIYGLEILEEARTMSMLVIGQPQKNHHP